MIKGILLSGGTGSRLHPTTISFSKQLLPVYDKPMIYYPISILMLAGIREILIITNHEYIENYKRLLGNGDKFGIKFKYLVQKKPNGIAESFILGEKFIGNDDVCLILGDNIFYGNNLIKLISKSINILKLKKEATIFGYHAKEPNKYGVAKIDKNSNLLKIIEKPKSYIGDIAITGFYIYPKDVISKAKFNKPSKRGELEITFINNMFIKEKRMNLSILDRGFTWLDMGTPDSLLEASNLIQSIEKRQNFKIACLEEIALNNNLINKNKLRKNLKKYYNNDYKEYLLKLINKK